MDSQYLTIYDIAPGKEIAGRFTIVGPNRQGGFSTAYEAKDENGDRCEIQFFPAGLFEDSGQVGDFETRMKPWTDVDHPAVIKVRELLPLEPDGLALVTDFPEGESLRARLNEDGQIAPKLVVDLGRQLLSGLEAIHAGGLHHGDIKPYSIHVSGGADGQPIQGCLVDGGVTPGLWTAKSLGDKTALIGTPYYAPVEQFGGDAPDVRSDIYNLATVLYESIAGKLPWIGKSFLEVFQAKLQDPPPFSQRAPGVSVDRKLEDAISRGCLADRRKRYNSASEFLAALS